MSTKIYDGFKLSRRVNSLDKAFYMMQDLRKEARYVSEVETARMLAMHACCIYDDHTVFGTPVGKSPLQAARDAIDNDLEDAAKIRRKSYYDLEFGVALGVTNDKTVIGILYSTNPEMRKLLLNHPDVMDYGYWDDSDEPDNVTSKDWAKRRGHWNEVLRDGIPAQEMFNITFHPEYVLPYVEKEDVAKQLVTFEKRLQRVAEQSTMAKAVEELNLDSRYKVIQYRMGGDYETRLDAEKVLLSEKMKHDLTIEDLLEKI